jgi:8-oxo-dGTP pyrophosphatase MutT (NUDIX family)
LLILKPSYKEGWNLPGGVTDKFESPYQTVIRECKEETNLDIQIKELVLIDYIQETIDGHNFDHVEFYFTAIAKSFTDIKIDNEEVIDYKFVDTTQAKEFLSENYYNRLQAVLRAKSYPVLFDNKKPLKS